MWPFIYSKGINVVFVIPFVDLGPVSRGKKFSSLENDLTNRKDNGSAMIRVSLQKQTQGRTL